MKVTDLRYQLSRFNALMQNFSIAVDATETSINSQGSAMKENEKYMQSLQARTQLMKTAWDTFALSVGETVIKDAVIAITAALTGLANAFTFLNEHGGALPILLGTITAALFLTNEAFRKTIVNITLATTSLFRLPAAAAAGRVGLNGLTISAQGLGLALRSLALATGVGVVFFAIGKAMEFFTHKAADAAGEIDSFADAQDRLKDQQNQLKTLQGLRDEYVNLRSKLRLTAEETTRLSSVENQLSSEFGFSTQALDRQKGSYESNTKAINDRIESMEKEAQLERDKLARDYQNNSVDIDNSIQDNIDNAVKLREEYAAAEAAVDDYLKKVKSGQKFDLTYQKKVGGTNTIEIDPSDENAVNAGLERLRREADARREAFNTADTEFRSNVMKKQEALRASLANYFDTMEAQGKEVPDRLRAAGNALASAYAQSGISDAQFTDKLPQIFEELQKISGVQFNPNSIHDFGQSAKNTTVSLEDMVDVVNRFTGQVLDDKQIQEWNNEMARMGYVVDVGKYGMDGLTDSVDGLNNALTEASENILSTEDMAKEFEKTSDAIKPLNTLLYDMNRGQKLNSEEVGDLIAKYPELSDAIVQNADGWTVERSAVEELRDSRLKAFNELIDQQKNGAIATFNAIASNVKQYGVEVQAIDEVGQALAELDKFRQALADQKKAEDIGKAMSDSFFSTLPDDVADQFRALGDPFGKINDATKDNTKAIEDNMNAYKSQYDSFKEVESQLDGYKDVLTDTTYGTTAQADAQKEAEDAAKAAKDAQDKLNSAYGDTVEILTDLQKSLQKVQDQMDAEARKRERLKKGTKEYADSIRTEIGLLEKRAKLLEQGVNDPTQLISTTATTKYAPDSITNSGGGATVTSGSGLQGLFDKAADFVDNGVFRYEQIGGKFQGSFEKFIQRGISDCSQYVQEMYEEFLNITLPRTAIEQSKLGTAVNKKDLQPGDLLFFNTNGKSDASHVGIYMGNGKFTQMGKKGLTVNSDLDSSYWKPLYRSARRIDGVSESLTSYNPNTSTSVPSNKKAYTGQYQNEITTAANKYNVDPILLASLVKQESSFNPNAKSSAGAIGLSQLMPATAKGLGVKNSYDVQQNLDGGAKYLSQMLTKYNGNTALALMAYNGGPGTVDKYLAAGNDLSKLKKETKEYAPKVLANYESLSGGISAPTSVDVGGGYITEYSNMTTQDKTNAANQAQQELNKIPSDIYKLQIDLVENAITGFEEEITRIDRSIQNSERTQSNYIENSKQWRNEESKQINYRKQQIEVIKNENKEALKLVNEGKIDRRIYDATFADNIQRIKDLEQNNIESNTAIFNSTFGETEKQITAVNRELSKSELLVANMDTSSEAYRKELQRQIKLQKQLVVINKQRMAAIKERLKVEGLTQVERDSLTTEYSNLSMENLQINDSVKDNISKYTDSQLEAFQNRYRILNNAMDVSKSKMALLEEGSVAWRQEIQKQISYTDRLIKAHQEEQAMIAKILKRTDLDATYRKQLTEAYDEETKAIYSLQVARKGLTDDLFNVDEIISNYKKMIEKRKELEMDYYDEVKEKAEKAHEDTLKMYEDEYSAFEKMVNDRIKLRDRENATDDYEKELQKKLKERQKIIDQMNLWQGDDSLEGKKKRKELQEQLDASNEEIDKFTLDRKREMQNQADQDLLDDKKDYYDDLKKSEDKSYKQTIDNNDKLKKEREQYYDDIINDEKKWYDLKQGLMSKDQSIVNSTLALIKADYKLFFEDLAKNSQIASEQMRANLNYSFGKDASTLDQYQNYIDTGDVGKTKEQANTEKISAWKTYLSNKQKAERLQELKIAANQAGAKSSTQYYKNLDAQFQELKKANEALRNKYKFDDGTYASLKDRDVTSLDTGGFTGDWSGNEGKLALLHKKELVLKKDDTSLLMKAVGVTRNVFSNLGSNITNKLGSMTNFNRNNTDQSTKTDNSITVQNLTIQASDKDTANTLQDKFFKGLQRQINLGTV